MVKSYIILAKGSNLFMRTDITYRNNGKVANSYRSAISSFAKWFVAFMFAAVVCAGFHTDTYSASYSDVRSGDWFAASVTDLSGRGVISGFPDGTFRPESTVLADAFIKMTVTSLGYTNIGNAAGESWAAGYIFKAMELGLVEQGEFDIYSRAITRSEMSRIIVRALDISASEEIYPDNLEAYADLISDYASIGAEFRTYILKAYCKGILTGYPDGTFGGGLSTKRSEAATIILRLVDPQKRILPESADGDDDTGGTLILFDSSAGKFIPVETTHPELIPHIRRGIEILSGTNSQVRYSKELNQVDMTMYTDDSDMSLPPQERMAVLGYHLYVEVNPLDDTYLPYAINLFSATNTSAGGVFKQIISDTFPIVYDTVITELNRKIADINYEDKLFIITGGREVRIFTFKGLNQIDVYIAPETISN